ncbi:AzlD domain-containing protein [Schleiferilactobacillus harbinensis]|uniref:AzlD domain-containing protein n=1 Tax=Schleiferilactobacillus harbinensis TaxID=304207 RepID=UPI001238EA91|nr:AzlD domain-containing protein [Schleiferilactobacillus harbinensis]QEU46035.1 AzlD domain-containing protein [Schleiferilactobacillus harbinensis]
MTEYVLAAIILSGLATWLIRVVPFILVKRFTLPAWLVEFLSFVPVAILTAIYVESLLTYRPGQWPGVNAANLLASLPTFLAAIISKNLLVIVIVGIASMAVIRLLGWA